MLLYVETWLPFLGLALTAAVLFAVSVIHYWRRRVLAAAKPAAPDVQREEIWGGDQRL